MKIFVCLNFTLGHLIYEVVINKISKVLEAWDLERSNDLARKYIWKFVPDNYPHSSGAVTCETTLTRILISSVVWTTVNTQVSSISYIT